jgi:hypothetical protein
LIFFFFVSYGYDYYSIYESALVYCVSRRPVHGVYRRYRTAANPIWAAAAAATQTRKKWNARRTVNIKRPCKFYTENPIRCAHVNTQAWLRWCAGNGEVGQSCQQPETIRRKKPRIPRDGGISSLFILFWPISPMSLSSVPPFCFGYLTISSFVLHLSADPQHQKKKPKTKSREIYKRNWRFGVNREMATVIWTRPSLSTTVCW